MVGTLCLSSTVVSTMIIWSMLMMEQYLNLLTQILNAFSMKLLKRTVTSWLNTAWFYTLERKSNSVYVGWVSPIYDCLMNHKLAVIVSIFLVWARVCWVMFTPPNMRAISSA